MHRQLTSSHRIPVCRQLSWLMPFNTAAAWLCRQIMTPSSEESCYLLSRYHPGEPDTPCFVIIAGQCNTVLVRNLRQQLLDIPVHWLAAHTYVIIADQCITVLIRDMQWQFLAMAILPTQLICIVAAKQHMVGQTQSMRTPPWHHQVCLAWCSDF